MRNGVDQLLSTAGEGEDVYKYGAPGFTDLPFPEERMTQNNVAETARGEHGVDLAPAVDKLLEEMLDEYPVMDTALFAALPPATQRAVAQTARYLFGSTAAEREPPRDCLAAGSPCRKIDARRSGRSKTGSPTSRKK